jgi:mevalonate kinase
MLYKASAPGSVMLLGEYAVLHGEPALVCAVDKRMTVTLTPRRDDTIELISTLGHYQVSLSNLNVVPPFQFVLTAIKHYAHYLAQGFTLHIESEFSHQIGFGSSAAVTVATVAVLCNWLGLMHSKEAWIHSARHIVQNVQGTGSGADVSASVMGGVVAYQMDPLYAECVSHSLPITLVYSGSKTPTVAALDYVKKRFLSYPVLFSQLMQCIGQCVKDGMTALNAHRLAELGRVMTIQQHLLAALGVNTPVLADIVQALHAEEKIFGAKISGSGLGDCVVGLGEVSPQFRYETIPVEVATQGVYCE